MAPTDATTFTATDPDGAAITLSLSGADSDKFEFIELTDPRSPTARWSLSRRSPTSRSRGTVTRDNIYEVTVEASDKVHTTSRSVTVKVTDADEDGKVSLSTQDAVVGSPITATLTDSDRDVDLRDQVARLSWTWQNTTPAAGTTCAALTNPDWEPISGAKSATYTPAAGDNGDCLRAMAWYMDRTTTEVDTDPL